VSDKTLFSIFLPATGRNYDIWVPREISVYEAVQLVGGILAKREARYFEPQASMALYYALDGAEIAGDVSVGSLNLNNGARLILV
jgi:hypothetical protein